MGLFKYNDMHEQNPLSKMKKVLVFGFIVLAAMILSVFWGIFFPQGPR
jgi:hypothetical protein